VAACVLASAGVSETDLLRFCRTALSGWQAPKRIFIVDMIPTGPTINPLAKTVRSVWAGVATSLLAGNITAADVSAAIDQMFALSPYLVAAP